MRVLGLVVFVLILVGIANCNAQDVSVSRPNTVVVMGMIHSKHRTSQRYSLDRVQSIIRSVNPDYVLTEIPPDRLAAAAEQFVQTGKITESRVSVFPEYTDALFPLTKELKFEIIPCAAWTKEMSDSRRETLAKLQESHSDEYAEMQSAQATAGEKILELGPENDPAIIHTDQYDEIVRQGMLPYDEHFNDLIGDGGWSNINAAHYAYIEKALDEHPNEGKTFLITFGAWHKYYIKEQLSLRSDIQLISLQQFLGANETEQPSEWAQFRLNTSNIGSHGETEIKSPKEVWRFATGDVIESSPAVCNGTVFIGGHSKNLFALDAATGKEQWVFPSEGWIRASPSVVDGVVYIGSDDNKFYAVDAANGKKLWEFGLGEGGEQSSPLIADGVVYFGAFDGFVYALDATNGEEQWRFDAGASMLSSPAASSDAVFIATYEGKLFSIDRETGKQRWMFQANQRPMFSSPALVDGVLYVTSYDHHVYAIDAQSGEAIWKRKTGGEIFSSPAVDNGVVFVGSNDRKLYALQSKDGEVVWTANLNGAVFASPAVSKETVYVGSSDGSFYALNRETGKEVWRYLVQKDMNVWSSAAAVDGRVYFGSHAGEVIALEDGVSKADVLKDDASKGDQ